MTGDFGPFSEYDEVTDFFPRRSSPALLDKNSGPNLVIVAVRSLTDATIFLSQL